eukprot:361198-Prymnesium_polylepis.1
MNERVLVHVREDAGSGGLGDELVCTREAFEGVGLSPPGQRGVRLLPAVCADVDDTALLLRRQLERMLHRRVQQAGTLLELVEVELSVVPPGEHRQGERRRRSHVSGAFCVARMVAGAPRCWLLGLDEPTRDVTFRVRFGN